MLNSVSLSPLSAQQLPEKEAGPFVHHQTRELHLHTQCTHERLFINSVVYLNPMSSSYHQRERKLGLTLSYHNVIQTIIHDSLAKVFLCCSIQFFVDQIDCETLMCSTVARFFVGDHSIASCRKSCCFAVQ